jgi:hypothetical protein
MDLSESHTTIPPMRLQMCWMRPSSRALPNIWQDLMYWFQLSPIMKRRQFWQNTNPALLRSVGRLLPRLLKVRESWNSHRDLAVPPCLFFSHFYLGIGTRTLSPCPIDICYDRVPGQGRSVLCTPNETIAQGGGACNLVAKAFLDQAPSADLAIQNAGGCRTDIAAGNFTVNDVFMLLPFANTLVTLEMTGGEIIEVLNIAATQALSGIADGAYPYASGIRYDVDATNAETPVSNVEVNVRLESNWSAIDENALYTVVTNSYLAAGGDGYVTFVEIEDVTDLYLEYANTFVQYAEEVGTLIDPPRSEYSTQNFIPSDTQGTISPTEPAAGESTNPPNASGSATCRMVLLPIALLLALASL